jgi:endonuclease III
LEKLHSLGLFTRDTLAQSKNLNRVAEVMKLAGGINKVKASHLHKLAKNVLERYNGIVPMHYDDLISFDGVGPKCANIFLGEVGHYCAGIGVDIHVARISIAMDWIPREFNEPTVAEKVLGLSGPEANKKIKGCNWTKIEVGLAKWLPRHELSKVNVELAGLGQHLGNKSTRERIFQLVDAEIFLGTEDRLEMKAMLQVLGVYYGDRHDYEATDTEPDE